MTGPGSPSTCCLHSLWTDSLRSPFAESFDVICELRLNDFYKAVDRGDHRPWWCRSQSFKNGLGPGSANGPVRLEVSHYISTFALQGQALQHCTLWYNLHSSYLRPSFSSLSSKIRMVRLIRLLKLARMLKMGKTLRLCLLKDFWPCSLHCLWKEKHLISILRPDLSARQARSKDRRHAGSLSFDIEAFWICVGRGCESGKH